MMQPLQYTDTAIDTGLAARHVYGRGPVLADPAFTDAPAADPAFTDAPAADPALTDAPGADPAFTDAPGIDPAAIVRGADFAGVRKLPWQEMLAPYSRPRLWRSLVDIATSVFPYLGLSALMYLALAAGMSYLIVLAIAVPASGFLVRTFILFHDCTHGSLFRSRRANAWLGTALGVIVYAPFLRWRHDHAIHHATSGDLDRRGGGDVRTLTVSEYYAMKPRARLGYRLFRNPLIMFGVGPIVAMIIGPRMIARDARPRMRRSVIGTNIALAVLLAALCLLLGWSRFLLVQAPEVMLAGSAGIWLFYVQHQFENAYWKNTQGWNYAEAALRGSSYLKLPKILQFFSGNIGLHHVHHLNARIPNYNLQRAHDENPVFRSVPTLSLWDGICAVRLKLWDEDRGRLVSFAEARSSPAASAQ